MLLRSPTLLLGGHSLSRPFAGFLPFPQSRIAGAVRLPAIALFWKRTETMMKAKTIRKVKTAVKWIVSIFCIFGLLFAAVRHAQKEQERKIQEGRKYR